MAEFIINEWLWADLSAKNGRAKQRESLEGLEKLTTLSHRIVLIEGSAFDRKAWSLCKNTESMIVQQIGGWFVSNIRQNSNLCLILKPEQAAAIPEELISKVKVDDHYLLQAQLAVLGSTLVTTDTPLQKIIVESGLNCWSREEFLEELTSADLE